jgi:hypothetical protein
MLLKHELWFCENWDTKWKLKMMESFKKKKRGDTSNRWKLKMIFFIKKVKIDGPGSFIKEIWLLYLMWRRTNSFYAMLILKYHRNIPKRANVYTCIIYNYTPNEHTKSCYFNSIRRYNYNNMAIVYKGCWGGKNRKERNSVIMSRYNGIF